MRNLIALIVFALVAAPVAATTVGGVDYAYTVESTKVDLGTGAVAPASPLAFQAGAETEDATVEGTAPSCDVDTGAVRAPSCDVADAPTLALGGTPTVTYDVDVALPFAESSSPTTAYEPSVREMVAYGGAVELTTAQLAVAAAAAGASAGVLYAVWRALKTGGLLALVPLATHLSPSELLNDPHRKAIHDLIRTEPGISTKDIADRLGLAWGTVTHHLLKLEKGRFVVSQKFGKYRRYFVNGSGIEAKEQVAVLKVARTSDVVTYVRAHPGASQKDVSLGMGVSSSTVLWHVKRLIHVGVLDKVRDGKSVRYFVKDAPVTGAAVAAPAPPMVVTQPPY